MPAPAALYHNFDTPPAPKSPSDAVRWDEGRRRRRLLSGQWAGDLETRLRQHFGRVRRVAMGPKSLAKNPFRKLCHELAVTYEDAPRCRHAVRGELPEFFGRDGILTRVGLWPMMRRVQVMLIGLREMILRPDWSPELDRPIVRMITPDVVTAQAFASAPNIPVEIRELRWRTLPSGEGMWTWDWLSIADPKAPFYRVVEARLDGSDGEDLTRYLFNGRLEGADYPYRWKTGARAGQPFLPYVLYHAMRKECLWDPYEGIEVVEGSLDVATAYTFLQHTIFKASWPQRYAMGAFVVGAAPVMTQAGPRTEVPTDPSSLLHLEAAPGVQNPLVGQWGAACDVESLARTVGILERAVSDFDGLDNSHIVHDTANPWSAAALSITREGKRQAQKRYQPELHPSDLETIEKLAAICNLAGATSAVLPEDGYLLDYPCMPLSKDEAEERRSSNADLIAQGRLSIIDAFQNEHPGMEKPEAIAELKRMATENTEFGVTAGTAPTTVLAGAAALAAGASGAKDAAAAADIISRVASGALPRISAIALLGTFFNLDADEADALLGTVGTPEFEPSKPPARPNTPPPGT